eukprot:scaffold1411_cov396-Prasinococcus_capsulatus_cf.AAC.33
MFARPLGMSAPGYHRRAPGLCTLMPSRRTRAAARHATCRSAGRPVASPPPCDRHVKQIRCGRRRGADF